MNEKVVMFLFFRDLNMSGNSLHLKYDMKLHCYNSFFYFIFHVVNYFECG